MPLKLHGRVRSFVCGTALLGAVGVADGGQTPAALTPAAASPRAAERPYALMAGDPAPALTASKWLKRGAMEAVQPGKPYVVEFWADWCIPCMAGIPRLTELQAKYKDKATIVGVAVWESDPAETVRYIESQGDRMRYLVALDEVPPAPAGADMREWTYEKGRMSQSWLAASGQTGIPVAFIVDAEGTIAWIGDPKDMEEPLASVIEGRWAGAAFAAQYARTMGIKRRSLEIGEALAKARRAHEGARALDLVEQLLALGPENARYVGDKFEVLLVDVNEPARAYGFAREAIAGVASGNQPSLNKIAATIIRQPAGPARDLDVALAAAERSVAVTEGKHSRTVKLLAEVHAARGEFKQAAEVMRRAVAVAYPEERPEFEHQLAGYERRAGGGR